MIVWFVGEQEDLLLSLLRGEKKREARTTAGGGMGKLECGDACCSAQHQKARMNRGSRANALVKQEYKDGERVFWTGYRTRSEHSASLPYYEYQELIHRRCLP